MKHFFLIAIFAALVSFSSATIWHVNNNPGVFTDFTQLQEAHNSASVVSGDTLYIYGSSIQYNDVNLNSKTLTIIGPGYFLGENTGLQQNPLPANINSINIYSTAAGTVLAGLQIYYLSVQNPNVSIVRCLLSSVTIVSYNCSIRQCYLFQSYAWSNLLSADGANNLIIDNCFIGGSAGASCISIPNNSAATISNSTIAGNLTMNNTLFFNNIVANSNPVTTLTWNADLDCTIQYNVFASITDWDWDAHLSPGFNNVTDYPNQLFVGTGSTDSKWQLTGTGNPALTAGISGSQCGMFGGQNPYVLSGIPAIPSIYELLVPSSGHTLPLQVKARANN